MPPAPLSQGKTSLKGHLPHAAFLDWARHCQLLSVILKHLIHAIQITFIRLYDDLSLLDCRRLGVQDYFIHPVVLKPSTVSKMVVLRIVYGMNG